MLFFFFLVTREEESKIFLPKTEKSTLDVILVFNRIKVKIIRDIQ